MRFAAIHFILALNVSAQSFTGIAGNEMHFNLKSGNHWNRQGDTWANPNTGELGAEYSYIQTYPETCTQPYTIQYDFDFYVNNESGVSWGEDVEYIDIIRNDTMYHPRDTMAKPILQLYGGCYLNNFKNDTNWHHYTIRFEGQALDMISLRISYDCDNYTVNSYRHGYPSGIQIRGLKWTVYPKPATHDTGLVVLAFDSTAKSRRVTVPYCDPVEYTYCDMMGRPVAKENLQRGVMYVRKENLTSKIIFIQ